MMWKVPGTLSQVEIAPVILHREVVEGMIDRTDIADAADAADATNGAAL
jgi:hypothetical protein